VTVHPPISGPVIGFLRWGLVAWGAFLGLCLLKFGNPVVLDHQIPPPASLSEALADPWPLRWAYGVAALLVAAGIPAAWNAARSGGLGLRRWLWMPPLLWLAWQVLAAGQTVDASLSVPTLLQFTGIVAAYGAGLLLLSDRRRLVWVLAGLLAGLCLCLMRAVNQRTEFPQMRAALIEGEHNGWTNFPPPVLLDMERQRLVLTTNGVRIANPLILLKLERGRVHGTLVYPNALAGAVLLLLPALLVLVWQSTREARPFTRRAASGLLAGLGLVALAWSGSKSGWLIALGMLGALAVRLPSVRRWRWPLVALVLGGGLVAFGLRFQGYFAAGATSVGARMDYWSAAAKTARDAPLLGTGPGTFQRPYARLKAPESEMARLAHNDYLEQFSDSGLPGGLLYLAWIGAWFVLAARRSWNSADPLVTAAGLGVAAWFVQGFSEFSLYVPALAWTAFTLAGAVARITARETNPSATPPPSAPRAS